VGISGFESNARQLSLWDSPRNSDNRELQSALDEIRHKFGVDAIKRGNQVEPETDD